jgi:GntR family transcriptional regulator/MocR family aminotransferase
LELQGWLVTKLRSGTYISQALPEQGLADKHQQIVDSSPKTKPPSVLMTSLYQEALSTYTETQFPTMAFLIRA